MSLDPSWAEPLARLQFAFTIMFHYLFPPLTIGLGLLMVIMEGIYVKTGNRQYEAMARFWTKIFALNFAIGVASGIVMEFEFGTNWAKYSRFVGDVFGSALAAEGIFAFFLESGFLAVVVFGWDRVSKRMHFTATILVALGSIFSAVWIIVANSWQQTPAGSHIVLQDLGGRLAPRAEVTDFWAVLFNPSTVDRLTHTLIGAFIMGAFFVMSVSAFYILRRRHVEISKKTFTLALVVGTISSLAILFSGHSNANMVAEQQPGKLAALEGQFETGAGGAPLHIVGWPDAEEKRVKGGIAIPGLLSFLVHGDWDEPVTGLDRIPRENWPNLPISFVSYHVMVGLGFFFIALTLVASFFRWRGTLFEKRWLMWVFVVAVIGPVISNQFGWVAAEVGRQPWIVDPGVVRGADGNLVLDENGLVQYRSEELPNGESIVAGLKTSNGLSESVPAEHILISIIMFGVIYLLLFIVWVYVLDSKIKQGPVELAEGPAEDKKGFFDAAASMADPGGASMTGSRDDRESRSSDDA